MNQKYVLSLVLVAVSSLAVFAAEPTPLIAQEGGLGGCEPVVKPSARKLFIEPQIVMIVGAIVTQDIQIVRTELEGNSQQIWIKDKNGLAEELLGFHSHRLSLIYDRNAPDVPPAVTLHDDQGALKLTDFGSVKSPIPPGPGPENKVLVFNPPEMDKAALLLINLEGWLTTVAIVRTVTP